MSDYDKQQWQAEQAARDTALEAQRARETKARERSARNAQRKLERLHRTLKESGELTEWEDEFAGSVQQRIDEFGSAFNDLQKGRPGDALSFAQKRVVASLNKKVKDARKAAKASRMAGGAEPDAEETAKPAYKRRSSFKSKKPKFTPRVRQLDEDMFEAPPPVAPPHGPHVPDAPRMKDFPPLRSVPPSTPDLPPDLSPTPVPRPASGPPKLVSSQAPLSASSYPRSSASSVPPKAERETQPKSESAARPFLRLVKTGSA